MPWWATLLEMIGLPALKFALSILEAKFPGIAPIIQKIIDYLSGQPNQAQALAKLQEHWSKFDSSIVGNAPQPVTN